MGRDLGAGVTEDRLPPEDRLLTAEEVADLLSVPTRWVEEHTRSGLIPCVQLGRYRRYRRESVVLWITEQETTGAAWRKHRPKLKPVPESSTG